MTPPGDRLVRRPKPNDGVAVLGHRAGLHTVQEGKSLEHPDGIAISIPDSGLLILVSNLRELAP